jgi:hypothetical protein
MLTWITYKAQHSDTALGLDRTRKSFKCNALFADLGKYLQNLNFWKIQFSQIFQFSCNYAYRIYCQIHVKACFWGRLAHKSISNSERWAAKPRAERSTCLPCRDLDLIKNSGAKIITVNYYACIKFHKSCRFQLNFVNRLSFDFSIVDFRSAQVWEHSNF